MTYHNLKCPHCKNSLGRITGNPNVIGNPFFPCPFCKKTLSNPFIHEWVTKSPFKRFLYYFEIPIASAFLSFILLCGIMSMSNSFSVAFGVSFGIAAVIFAIVLLAHKSNSKPKIQQSLERTKDAVHVNNLKNAGYKIYPVKGAEIATLNRDKEENITEKAEKPTDFTLTLH